jgi:hypothetical protein
VFGSKCNTVHSVAASDDDHLLEMTGTAMPTEGGDAEALKAVGATPKQSTMKCDACGKVSTVPHTLSVGLRCQCGYVNSTRALTLAPGHARALRKLQGRLQRRGEAPVL